MNEHDRGFTLTELLVVIAILSLLLAILLPTLGRTREIARRIACSAQLHQIGAQLQAYSDDYHGQLPPGNATLAPYWGIDSTRDVYRPTPYGVGFLIEGGYLGEARLCYCPSWKHPTLQYDYVDTTGIDWTFPPGAYGGWPAPGHRGPSRSWGISYHYRSTFGPKANTPPSVWMNNPAASAILLDQWVRREGVYGVVWGHKDAYMTFYGDGSVTPVYIPADEMLRIEPFRNNDSWYIQESLLKDLFDRARVEP